MLKLVAALTLATTAGASAETPKVCAKQPKSTKVRAMTVVAVGGQLVPGPGAEFPAVSADGKKMAELFVEKDGDGSPMATMEIWETAIPKEIGYEGSGGKGWDPKDAPVMAEIVNGKLAGTWRPIPVYVPCDPKKAATLTMADGLAYTVVDTLEHKSQVITRTINGADATDMRLRFEGLGVPAGKKDSEYARCSPVTEIAWGFGGLKEGLVVLVPGGVLAKGCVREPSAQNSNPYLTTGRGG